MRLNEAINLLQCKENNNMNGELINRRNCTFGKQLILKKYLGSYSIARKIAQYTEHANRIFLNYRNDKNMHQKYPIIVIVGDLPM